jgi:PKD repeat protein
VTITPDTATTTEWYWDFGDGSKDTLFNNNPFTHVYANAGVYTISHSIKTVGNCPRSANPVTVTVYANPFATSQ